LFYNKIIAAGDSFLRIEGRIFGGRLIKKNLHHDPIVEEMCKRSFYMNCCKYLVKLILLSTRSHSDNEDLLELRWATNNCMVKAELLPSHWDKVY
jgi:hypothetical protein